MIPSLTAALRQVHKDLAAVLHPAAIQAACRNAGHRWRDRRLDPVATVHLFVLHILHRNTACAHLPRWTGRTFSASAYRQAGPDSRGPSSRRSGPGPPTPRVR